MRAMQLAAAHQDLKLLEVDVPTPSVSQVLIKVIACGICRTDLHIMDGELTEPKLPLTPGHQIVGEIVELGQDVSGLTKGELVGVPWLGYTCGECRYCQSDRENLCEHAKFTGYNIDGGLAEYCVADARYCFPIPKDYPAEQAAPLLCAGLIGYRAYKKVGDAKKIGIYGFGAAAHILAQTAISQGREVYAFTSKGDTQAQAFAKELGASWVGDSSKLPDSVLDAAIIFAPVGELVPQALKAIDKGGKVVCGGIHMSDIPSFPYSILWGERSVSSVANLTRQDGVEFLQLAPQVPVKTEVNVYPLEKANEALADLRNGRFNGSYVIKL